MWENYKQYESTTAKVKKSENFGNILFYPSFN